MPRAREHDSVDTENGRSGHRHIHYLVRPREEVWVIETGGEEFGPYESRRVAMFCAIDAAHKLGIRGKPTQVRLTDDTGRPLTTWTYGNDPYPPYL
jgi:hypothetical protein